MWTTHNKLNTPLPPPASHTCSFETPCQSPHLHGASSLSPLPYPVDYQVLSVLSKMTQFIYRVFPLILSLIISVFFSFQFSSVAKLCPTLCDPMNRSTPGLPIHHHLPEFTQTHVHRVSDAIQPSHPSPPAPNPSQHQSLFQ